MVETYTPAAFNATTWIFTSLAVLAVALRLLSRMKLSNWAGFDDAFCVLALLIDVAFTGLVTAAVSVGLGRPLDNVSLSELPHTIILITASSSFAVLSYSSPKLSVALLLVRIFNVKRWAKVLLVAPAVILILLAFAQIIDTWLNCSPPQAFWDPPKYPHAKCQSVNFDEGSAYLIGAVSAVLDLAYSAYPIFMFSKLMMKTKRKVALSLTMGCGTIAGIFGFYKLSKVADVAPPTPITVGIAPLIFWSSIEANLMIIAACIPTFANILRYTNSKSAIARSSMLKVLKPGDLENYQQFPGEDRTPQSITRQKEISITHSRQEAGQSRPEFSHSRSDFQHQRPPATVSRQDVGLAA